MVMLSCSPKTAKVPPFLAVLGFLCGIASTTIPHKKLLHDGSRADLVSRPEGGAGLNRRKMPFWMPGHLNVLIRLY